MNARVQISYEPFERLIAQFRAEGRADWAEALDTLLHRTVWTSGSELLGALGAELPRIRGAALSSNDSAEAAMDDARDMVRRVWPELG